MLLWQQWTGVSGAQSLAICLQPWQWCCYIDGLVQERRNSIANALELRCSCTNPLISLERWPAGWTLSPSGWWSTTPVQKALPRWSPHRAAMRVDGPNLTSCRSVETQGSRPSHGPLEWSYWPLWTQNKTNKGWDHRIKRGWIMHTNNWNICKVWQQELLSTRLGTNFN